MTLHDLLRLDIDASRTWGDVTVARVGNNRFLLIQGGQYAYFGGYNSSPQLAAARLLTALTGQPVEAGCTDCGAPREVRCYCRTHWNERTARYKVS